MTIETWVLLAVAGAFLQNLRSLLQRRLTGALSVQGASYSRFLYALPIAWLYCLWVGVQWPQGQGWQDFLGYSLSGGIAQIVGTYCLVAAVSSGSFAVGTAYSKTEAAQAALFGLLLIGDVVTLRLLLAIGLSFVGVAVLANARQQSGLAAATSWFDQRTLLLGLGAGAGFALSAVCFRGAALALPGGEFVERAAATLAVTLSLQTLIQGGYLLWREPSALRALTGSYGIGLWVGAAGMLASLCWFTAMAMHPAAEVRAVGQIEMLFTLLTGAILLREPIRAAELLGIGLILAGIYLLLAT